MTGASNTEERLATAELEEQRADQDREEIVADLRALLAEPDLSVMKARSKTLMRRLDDAQARLSTARLTIRALRKSQVRCGYPAAMSDDERRALLDDPGWAPCSEW